MAPNLLPALKNALTPELTAALANASGTTHAALHSANDTWTALLLGALAHRAAGDGGGGASAVRELLASPALQGAAQASAAFAATPSDDTMRALAGPGDSLLDALLGSARRGRVTLALAAVSGLSAPAAQHLAWTSSAMALSALSHALPPDVRRDDAALRALLRAQAPSLDRQLDARLTTAAGLGSPSALMAALQGESADNALSAGPAHRWVGAAGLPAAHAGRWTGAVGRAASAALGLGLVGWVASLLATVDSRDRLAGTLPTAASHPAPAASDTLLAASGAVSAAVSGTAAADAAHRRPGVFRERAVGGG
jgi:hypothetical protein